MDTRASIQSAPEEVKSAVPTPYVADLSLADAVIVYKRQVLRAAIALKCQDGAADTLRTVLSEITADSRAEEGSLAFETYKSLEEQNVFLVHESYVDEEAYNAHLGTPAFPRVERELLPLDAERDVRTYRPLAA